mmetsp:Transcript_6141/g.7542  ORF Transcript_6141/g.7542 Transcript_6141/m.7542 type:complete len:137 (-) Transcript_6141:290-700(-)
MKLTRQSILSSLSILSEEYIGSKVNSLDFWFNFTCPLVTISFNSIPESTNANEEQLVIQFIKLSNEEFEFGLEFVEMTETNISMVDLGYFSNSIHGSNDVSKYEEIFCSMFVNEGLPLLLKLVALPLNVISLGCVT